MLEDASGLGSQCVRVWGRTACRATAGAPVQEDRGGAGFGFYVISFSARHCRRRPALLAQAGPARY